MATSVEERLGLSSLAEGGVAGDTGVAIVVFSKERVVSGDGGIDLEDVRLELNVISM